MSRISKDFEFRKDCWYLSDVVISSGGLLALGECTQPSDVYGTMSNSENAWEGVAIKYISESEAEPPEFECIIDDLIPNSFLEIHGFFTFDVFLGAISSIPR